MIKLKPRYQHDCDTCEFLGWFADFDIYLHHRGEVVELLARYSDDGPDYACTSVMERNLYQPPAPQLMTDDPAERELYRKLAVACFHLHNSLACRLMKWEERPQPATDENRQTRTDAASPNCFIE